MNLQSWKQRKYRLNTNTEQELTYKMKIIQKTITKPPNHGTCWRDNISDKVIQKWGYDVEEKL